MIKSIILAAGKGTRMKSDTPKVLHTIFDKTLVGYVIEAVNKTGLVDENFVIVGHQAERVEEYINKNYSSQITLSILSQKFGCCNATLTKSFKNEYNLSIMSYLSEVRLEAAREMIAQTRLSFKEIANECGFYDQNYFSKLFNKKYNCSPTDFRKLSQAQG